jgi:hypothetical protein
MPLLDQHTHEVATDEPTTASDKDSHTEAYLEAASTSQRQGESLPVCSRTTANQRVLVQHIELGARIFKRVVE